MTTRSRLSFVPRRKNQANVIEARLAGAHKRLDDLVHSGARPEAIRMVRARISELEALR